MSSATALGHKDELLKDTRDRPSSGRICGAMASEQYPHFQVARHADRGQLHELDATDSEQGQALRDYRALYLASDPGLLTQWL